MVADIYLLKKFAKAGILPPKSVSMDDPVSVYSASES
jgi:hypothetical protein